MPVILASIAPEFKLITGDHPGAHTSRTPPVVGDGVLRGGVGVVPPLPPPMLPPAPPLCGASSGRPPGEKYLFLLNKG